MAARGFLPAFQRSIAFRDVGKYTKTITAREWGVATVLLDPGSVRTDMGGPNAPLLPEESAAGMIQVLDTLTLEQSGAFLNWQGKTMPW